MGVTSYRVAFDDGTNSWHRPGECAMEAVAEKDEDEAGEEAEVVCEEGEWQRVELRCALSLQPLRDPAKFSSCRHPGQCNYETLREHAVRNHMCPLVGCGAKCGARGRDIERDDTLRSLILHSPSVAVLWVRGDEAQATPPRAHERKRVRSADAEASEPGPSQSRPKRRQVIVLE